MSEPKAGRLDHLEALLVTDKPTAATIRFAEVEKPGGLLVVRTVYVQRKALELIGNPDAVQVIIKPVAWNRPQ